MADATVEAVRQRRHGASGPGADRAGPARRRRELGPAEQTTVSSGPGKILAFLAFFGVLIIGLLVIVGFSRIGAPWPSEHEDEDEDDLWDFADDDEAEPAPVAIPRRHTDGVAS